VTVQTVAHQPAPQPAAQPATEQSVAQDPGQHVQGGRQAAAQATSRNSVHLDVPVVGRVELPVSGNELGYLGGLGALAIAGILEWPVAGVLAAGHMLSAGHGNKALHDFGEALEEA
jgi:hypothetical protein